VPLVRADLKKELNHRLSRSEVFCHGLSRHRPNLTHPLAVLGDKRFDTKMARRPDWSGSPFHAASLPADR
jgi:hypothetical protein